MSSRASPFAASPAQPRLLWLAALASLLLHAAVPGALLLDPERLLAPWRQPPRETIVEVVFLPPLTAPEPKPEAKPEPPPPPQPKPDLPPPTPMVLAPPPPQLEEAPIAEKSEHVAAGEPHRAEPPAPAPAPAPRIERPRQRQPRGEARGGPPSPQVELPRRAEVPDLIDREQPTLGRGGRGSGASAAERRQQSEGDFVLAQIMPHWLIDVRSPRFRGVVLGGTFHLQADGTLAPPYGRSDPWAPDAMIQNYRQLHSSQGEPVRIALESFLRAARTAQPFRLPPGVGGGYPRPIRIVFNMGDL